MPRETRGPFEAILPSTNPGLQALCEALRALIRSLHGDCVEIVWPKLNIASYGIGPSKKTDHYAYIAVQSRHVNLGFYHGAVLEDPEGRLEGTGKALRHAKLRTATEAGEPWVAALLRQAIAERTSPTSGHAGP
jgi:hypothetical protein